MEIIGEKINGTRKPVAKAISDRNKDFIQDLAIKQKEAGATWLDLNAGTHPQDEVKDLLWLVKCAQEVVDIPLCIDSSSPVAIENVIDSVNRKPMINSISGESQRLEGILPLVSKYGCKVVALAMDGKRIPETIEKRIEVVKFLLEKTKTAGIPDENVYVDPLVMTLSTNTENGKIFFNTMNEIRSFFPNVHFTAGLSNISYGLPSRSLVNRTFLSLAISAGLDSAILDPLDKELMAVIFATELVTGTDKHCLHFTKAFREGRL